jgi:methylated-DNA-[protein]-cysteine S-methyltransferase
VKSAQYFTTVMSPLGSITLTATESSLCGLYLNGQKHWPKDADLWSRDDGPRFDAAREWLADYFTTQAGEKMPKVVFASGTDFQKRVWQALRNIPQGKTITYGQLAAQIHAVKAVRAVGAAVGRNPLSIIVPCHRVIGSSGALTGYAGGLERKRWLLEHEVGFRDP